MWTVQKPKGGSNSPADLTNPQAKSCLRNSSVNLSNVGNQHVSQARKIVLRGEQV